MFRQFVFGFIQITVRSFVLMAVVLTMGLSIITHEFPPDFRRIAKTYEQLQNYNAAAVPTPEAVTEPSRPLVESVSEESEIQRLSDLYEKRARIGRSLLDPKNTGPAFGPSAESPLKAAPSEQEIQILRAQLLTCEDRLRLYENLDTSNSPNSNNAE